MPALPRLSAHNEAITGSSPLLSTNDVEARTGPTSSFKHVIGDDFRIANQVEVVWLIADLSLTISTFILGDTYGCDCVLDTGFARYWLWYAGSRSQ